MCRRDNCLEEAIRRARWAHAFRAPAALMPETAARLRALIEAATEPSRSGRRCDDGALMPVRAAERAGAPVEGRC